MTVAGKVCHVSLFIYNINESIMATKKSNKSIYLYIFLTILGLIFAFSSIITNDYLKLVVVLVSLCAGVYGIMKGLSNPNTPAKNDATQE